MRKVVIGRGRECDIVLADTTDVVSRRQAVIAFTFWGKMTLYDTSSNGTFVNGQRLAKQEAKVVSRKDSINFGRVWDLDWEAVKDPYKKLKIALVCAVVALIVAVIALLFIPTPNHQDKMPMQLIQPMDTLTTDSAKQEQETIIPAITPEPVQPKAKAGIKNQQKHKSRRKRSNSYDYADSVAVDDDEPSFKTNEAPLIY